MTELQRIPEWYHAKIGKIGASQIYNIMSRNKSGYSASRNNYMTDLILERLTGQKTDSYTSPAMQYGIEMESEAKMQYELTTFNILTDCGFIIHPDIPDAGASPDALIGDNGVLEVKCFQPSNHLNYILNEEIETRYIYQMQWQIDCTERDYADFCCYNPKFPEGTKLFIKRVERDKIMIDNITEEVLKFIEEMKVKCTELQNKLNKEF